MIRKVERASGTAAFYNNGGHEYAKKPPKKGRATKVLLMELQTVIN